MLQLYHIAQEILQQIQDWIFTFIETLQWRIICVFFYFLLYVYTALYLEILWGVAEPVSMGNGLCVETGSSMTVFDW